MKERSNTERSNYGPKWNFFRTRFGYFSLLSTFRLWSCGSFCNSTLKVSIFDTQVFCFGLSIPNFRDMGKLFSSDCSKFGLLVINRLKVETKKIKVEWPNEG